MSTINSSRNKSLLVVTAIVAAVLGVLLARMLLTPPAAVMLSTGSVLNPAKPLPEFSLIDNQSQPFNAARLRGHWSLMFFGFTNCGDVCPTTLTTLASTMKALGNARDGLQVVFVSVDAKRDTPEILDRYVKAFDPTFVGVTGTQEQLDAFTKELGIPSAIRPLENGAYAVDHSAAILAINPQGEFRAIFSPPHAVAGLASDVRVLMGNSR